MSLTPSTMSALGGIAPPFSLPDYENRIIRRDDFKDAKTLLVMFICNHCPFVKHVRKALKELRDSYTTNDVAMVAISANDIATHPEDRPEKMRETAKKNGWSFPYLFDETQEVARAYRAACTPDFFLYKELKLVYRGQLDDSRPDNGKPVTGCDLRQAIDAVLAGQPVSEIQKPSIGCNIKWKS